MTNTFKDNKEPERRIGLMDIADIIGRDANPVRGLKQPIFGLKLADWTMPRYLNETLEKLAVNK